ncbi:hypothetical protein [Hymenobacter norwichensis]|uniref:hypothetical protein n=1 Tax=Hymenobacter norwichensis TaxID=223903 RepID=UPI0003B5D7F5|nr:hypothetical protein [Hymenobacter norwichensis]
MPKLTANQAIAIAKETFQRYGLTYDAQEGLAAQFTDVTTGATTDTPAAYWCVSYVSEPGVFEQHDFFMFIADDTGRMLYILGPHGKLRL